MGLFRHQAQHNPVYKLFLASLGIKPDKIHSLLSIPFMPISFFKSHELKTGAWTPETVFRSSGTSGTTTSRHLIRDLSFYHDHSVRCFEHFFGPVENYHFLALLPSYLERNDSSLVSMMAYFIRRSRSAYSGFYLNDVEKMLADAEKLKNDPGRTIVWGVTFALLDLAERFKPDLSHCLVFETGGMKGRRDEITRAALHETLRRGLHVDAVYSEYGMTELISQCYTTGENRFFCPPWVRVIARDISDPFEKGLVAETGAVNVIDLANWHSIGFIETEDLGRVEEDGSFEVLGRLDNSDVRGCNLLVNG